jgi:penicillin-binding protein 1A
LFAHKNNQTSEKLLKEESSKASSREAHKKFQKKLQEYSIELFINNEEEKEIAKSAQTQKEINDNNKAKIFPQILLKSITFVGFLITISSVVFFSILWKHGRDLPDYYFLKNYQPSSITHLYNRFGRQIKTYAYERREYVHLSDIPPKLVHAFIAAEDKNFYNHCGIDFFGLIRAIINNTTQKRWRNNPFGASTITQQVAKIFLIGSKRDFQRKIKEAILSFRLESALSKDRILELYLNQIYLGVGSYGVSIAAKRYFRKSLVELNLPECAFLASLPKAPIKQNPYKNPQKAKERRDWVLTRMLKNNIISKKDFTQAINTPIKVYPPDTFEEQKKTYFIEEARKKLIQLFGEKNTYSAGIEATLSINDNLQKLLDESLREGLERYDKRHPKWQGPICNIKLNNWLKELKSLSFSEDFNAIPAVVLIKSPLTIGLPDGNVIKLTNSYLADLDKKVKAGNIIFVRKIDENYAFFQIPEVTGGVVVLDAENGEILALSGGYSFDVNQFNCATQAFRQPASTFKPFVYLAALKQGYSEYSKLIEKPVSFNSSGGVYTPHNYNRNVYGGLMTLYEGLIFSRNVFTTILADKIGLKNVIKTAKEFGISDYFPQEMPIVLGTVETTVLRMAVAYASFFNGGYKIDPTLFLNITSRIDSKKFKMRKKNKKKKIISSENLEKMKHMLRGVIVQGTACHMEKFPNIPINIYGKTGSSGDLKDAWIVCGIEPKEVFSGEFNGIFKNGHSVVIAVFVGYPIPRSLGEGENGAKVALPIVECFLKKLFNRQ